MSDFTSTILAALIGAFFGSIGAVLTDHLMAARSERSRRRELLAQRYLFQLQDALEMLYYRLHNLANRGSRAVMSVKYYEITTLYALGRVLAMERIFALEAVYPQLDKIYPGLGKHLQKREYRVDLQLPGSFYQYDRLSLAETVIVHEGDVFRTSTFLEFRKQYEAEGTLEKEWLAPANKAIDSLPREQMEQLLETISQKAATIAEKTGIATSIHAHK